MRRSPLLPIFLVILVDVLGMTLILPLLPFYAQRFGATPLQCGLLISTFAACQLVSGPLLGGASDRFGRKPLLLVSQLGTFLGFLLLGFANSLTLVFLSRAIDGATAGNLSLAQAYIVDRTKPEERAKSFAVIGIAFGIGFFIGPAVSGRLAAIDYAYPVWLACALSLTSIVATATLLEGKEGDRQGAAAESGPGGKRLGLLEWGTYATFFQRRPLGVLLLQFLCFQLAFSMFTSGFALFAERTYAWEGHAFGAREIGYLFAWAGFLGILLQGGLVGRLVKRFGEARVAGWGFTALGLGYALLPVSSEVAVLVALSTLGSFGTAVLRPTLSALVTRLCGPGEQGLVLGLTQSLTSVAAIGAPLLAGLLIEHRLLWLWAVLAGAPALAGLLLRGRGSDAAQRQLALGAAATVTSPRAA